MNYSYYGSEFTNDVIATKLVSLCAKLNDKVKGCRIYVCANELNTHEFDLVIAYHLTDEILCYQSLFSNAVYKQNLCFLFLHKTVTEDMP
ncbi:MAG: hypothetical protein ACI308_01185 [Muribaculaceae bacterium]